MRMLPVLALALALAACDGNNTRIHMSGSELVPSTPFGMTIAPQSLGFFPSVAACPFSSTFDTSFNLVIVATSGRPSLDAVTFRLIDGTGLGGPAVTFPRAELNTMFGSTAIVGTRSFGFHPSFPCGHGHPSKMNADAVVVDASGNPQTLNVTAPFE